MATELKSTKYPRIFLEISDIFAHPKTHPNSSLAEGAGDQRPAGNAAQFREHWQSEVEEEPIEGIRRLFEDDNGNANVPDEETTAVTAETQGIVIKN